METEQRSISYLQLAVLEQMFTDEVAAKNIVFPDEEIKQEALFDYIEQYKNGEDNPKVNVYFKSQTQKIK